MATNAAAMPAAVLKKARRDMPCLARQLAAEFFDARLELALFFGLRRGHEFIAGYRLSR